MENYLIQYLIKVDGNLLGGKVGKHSAGGGTLTSLVGGKGATAGLSNMQALGNGLKNTAAGTKTASATTLGGVGTVAGVAAGGAMAIKGGSDVINDFKNNDVTWKTGASGVGAVGGAVGAGALLALGASNPVGWVALGIGAIALGARAIGEQMEDEAKMRESSMNAYQKQIDNEMKSREQEQDKYIQNLSVLREQVKRSSTDEQAKQLLIEAGIASKEELEKAEYQNRDALLALTDQYIASTKTKNEEDNAALKNLKEMDAKTKATNYADPAKGYMSWLLGGNGWNREMHELSGQDREAAYQLIAAVASYGENNYDNMSKEEKQIFDKIKELGIDKAKKGTDGPGGLNWEEVDSIIDKFDSQEGATSSLIERALGDSSILQEYSSNNAVKNKYGKDVFLNVDWQGAFDNYLVPASAAGITDKKARELLDSFKEATYTSSLDDFSDGTFKNYIQKIIDNHNLGSYAIGIDYVNANNQLAYLHEGEAVLTKSAADLLRSSTNESISSAHGVASILSESKMATKDSITSIVSAITNQTTILVAKIEAIYNVLVSNNRNTNYSHSMTGLKSN